MIRLEIDSHAILHVELARVELMLIITGCFCATLTIHAGFRAVTWVESIQSILSLMHTDNDHWIYSECIRYLYAIGAGAQLTRAASLS